MNKSTPVFRLIKHMTMNEKGYFKKFASKHVIGEKNNYVKLFDVLDKLKEYDKEELKKRFKAEGLVGDQVKNQSYLHKLILKSLYSFHSISSVDAELREGIYCIELLITKGLYDDAYHLLRRFLSTAKEYERSVQIIELLKLERRLVIETKDSEQMAKFQEVFQKDSRDQVEDIVSLMDIMEIHNYFLTFRFKYGSFGEGKQKEDVKSAFRHLLPKMEKLEGTLHSFESKRLLYNIGWSYYAFVGNLDSSRYWISKLVNLMETNLHQVKENLKMYIATLHNQALIMVKEKKYDEAWEPLRKIKEIPSQFSAVCTEDALLNIFYSFHIRLGLYLATGRFEDGIREIEEEKAESHLENFKEKISKNIVISTYLQLFELYFVMGNFSEALKWINRLLNDPNLKGTEENSNCHARLANLMVHFELGNHDLIEYLAKSTSRYLQKYEREYKCEKLFRNFIHKFANSKTVFEQDQLFKDFSEQIIALKSNPDEAEMIRVINLDTWIESKLSGKTFAEVHLENLKKK